MSKEKANQKVLLVDDEPEWLMVMKVLLRKLDARLETANNGIHAHELLKQEPADLVITDTNMPQMNGIALLKLIRHHKPKLPVIVLFSGLSGSALTDEDVIAAGANAVLSKSEVPLELGPLAEKILFNEQKKLNS